EGSGSPVPPVSSTWRRASGGSDSRTPDVPCSASRIHVPLGKPTSRFIRSRDTGACDVFSRFGAATDFGVAAPDVFALTGPSFPPFRGAPVPSLGRARLNGMGSALELGGAYRYAAANVQGLRRSQQRNGPRPEPSHAPAAQEEYAAGTMVHQGI